MIKIKLTKTTTLNPLLNTSRAHRFAAAKLKLQETIRARDEILEQHATPIPDIIGKIYVAFDITYCRNNSDPDNHTVCVKAIMDGLVKAGILKDDSFKHIHPYHYYRFIKESAKNQYIYLYLFFDKVSYNEHIQQTLED